MSSNQKTRQKEWSEQKQNHNSSLSTFTYNNNPRVANFGLYNQDVKNPEDIQTTPLRLLVLGSHGVGKSAATVRYLTRRFIGEYRSQIDIIYRQRVFLKDSRIDLEVIDISTKPEEWTLPTLEISQSDCYLVVYSIDDKSTMVYAQHLLKAIHKLCPPYSSMVITLLGNKKDLEPFRQVSVEDGIATARLFGCDFAEVSVADRSEDIVTVFINLIHNGFIGKTKQVYLKTGQFNEYKRTNKETENKINPSDIENKKYKDEKTCKKEVGQRCDQKGSPKRRTSHNSRNFENSRNTNLLKISTSFREPNVKKERKRSKDELNRSESLKDIKTKTNLKKQDRIKKYLSSNNGFTKEMHNKHIRENNKTKILPQSTPHEENKSVQNTKGILYVPGKSKSAYGYLETPTNLSIEQKERDFPKKPPFLMRCRSLMIDKPLLESKNISPKKTLERFNSFRTCSNKVEVASTIKYSASFKSIPPNKTQRSEFQKENSPLSFSNLRTSLKDCNKSSLNQPFQKTCSLDRSSIPAVKKPQTQDSKVKTQVSPPCSPPISNSRQRKFSVFGVGRVLGNILSKGSMPDLPRATANLYDKFGSLKNSIKKRSV